MLMNKLKFFIGDFIVFTPRTEAQVKADIESAQDGCFDKKLCNFEQAEKAVF